MKKLSFLPSILCVLAIMTLGLTSCSKKYGCFYSLTPEIKVHRTVDASKWIPASETMMLDETTNSSNCDPASSTSAN